MMKITNNYPPSHTSFFTYVLNQKKFLCFINKKVVSSLCLSAASPMSGPNSPKGLTLYALIQNRVNWVDYCRNGGTCVSILWPETTNNVLTKVQLASWLGCIAILQQQVFDNTANLDLGLLEINACYSYTCPYFCTTAEWVKYADNFNALLPL